MRLESALPAGADVRRHALSLARVWEATMAGGRAPQLPRQLVAESWARARRSGIDPEHGAEVALLSAEELHERRQASRFGAVLHVLRRGLAAIAEDAVHIMAVTDSDGRLLWREGSTSVLLRADALGFVEGALWAEDTVGTSGIGTGLFVRRSIQIFAAEHYVRSHHGWACSASLLRDPVDGRPLGIVDVSGPAATVHPSTLALVDSVTQLARLSLRHDHVRTLNRLRERAMPILARIAGAACVVDRHGWVASTSGLGVGDRLLLPAALPGGAAWIPSIGWCQVEPLHGGWLVRSVPSGARDRPPAVRLDLRGDPPTLVVVGSGGSFHYRLTTRHAEILLVLATHPIGRTARQLSWDLFGDPTHAVAVRAEVSRLTRRIGGLLDRRPYRFAPGLEVAADLPDHAGMLLPASAAPAVRALRAGSAVTP